MGLVLSEKIVCLRARRVNGFYIFKCVRDRGLVIEDHQSCILSAIERAVELQEEEASSSGAAISSGGSQEREHREEGKRRARCLC